MEKNVSSLLVEHAFRLYTSIPAHLDNLEVLSYLQSIRIPLLSPTDIEIVFYRVSQSKKGDYSRWRIGCFISTLIQASFDGGYNDFVLSNGLETLEDIGGGVKGRKECALELTCAGYSGLNLGMYSSYCAVRAAGDAQIGFSNCSKDSSFVVEGKATYPFGIGARNNKYLLLGELEVKEGMLFDDKYKLRESTLKTPNRDTFSALKMVIDSALGNTLELIEPDENRHKPYFNLGQDH